jgi:thymidine phosphorylase
MSKKLAGGADALVLDVKCGSGAFMKTLDEGRALACSMVEVGRAHGMRIKALVTRMEEPLGWAIGNALEVMESVEILKGMHGDGVLARMSFRLAAEMLLLGRAAGDLDTAMAQVERAVKEGTALRVLRDFIALNGGDARCLDDFSLLPRAGNVTEVRAEREGFVHAMDGRALGILAMDLGAGRRFREDRLDLGAGLRVHRSVGDPVRAGDVLFSVHARPGLAVPEAAFRETVDIRLEPAAAQPWLLDVIE